MLNENYDFIKYDEFSFVVNNEIKMFYNLNVQFFHIDIKTVENEITIITKIKTISIIAIKIDINFKNNHDIESTIVSQYVDLSIKIDYVDLKITTFDNVNYRKMKKKIDNFFNVEKISLKKFSKFQNFFKFKNTKKFLKFHDEFNVFES